MAENNTQYIYPEVGNKTKGRSYQDIPYL